MPDPPSDLLVVGGGTAGIVGAKTAAGLGARVLLVERDRTGGDCLWTGCVPSQGAAGRGRAPPPTPARGRLGVDVDGVQVDFAAVMAHVRSAIADDRAGRLPRGAARRPASQVAHGDARFTGPTPPTVDGGTVALPPGPARHRLRARPCRPSRAWPRPAPLTSDTVWDLDRAARPAGGARRRQRSAASWARRSPGSAPR